MFYTYAHYTPEGCLFYIGKGKGKRAYRFYNRGAYWNNVVSKHGKPNVQIIASWKTEKEALDHEVLLIKCFRDLGHKLCNQTDGGEGTSGRLLSSEHKEKISAKLKGRKGKIPDEKTKEKLRTSHLGQVAWNKGLKGVYKHSEEHKQKVSAFFKSHNFQLKNCYIGTHRYTNEIIKILGTNEAIKNAGFDPNNVRRCASGERKFHKDYSWNKERLEQ